MHVALMRNINALTEETLKTSKRESKKKSMMSRLAPDAEELFYLLSSEKWGGGDPTLNKFMKKLVKDKDASKALNMTQSKTAGWMGSVSSKQLLQFFAVGYRARNVDHSPGGFTAFMCHPYTSNYQASRAAIRADTRSMFGDGTLNEETITYYTQQEFFLPRTYDDVRNQLETTIKLLRMFTRRDSIALDGYILCQRRWLENPAIFHNILETRPSFGIEYVYMADKVFQSFLRRLSDFIDHSDPLRSARREGGLHKFQVRNVETALQGIDFGSLPRLTLPSSLKLAEPSRDTTARPSQVRSSGDGESGGQQQQGPEWWSTNSHPVADWKIPAGKEHGQIFNSRNNPRAAEVEFPKINHHKTGTPRVICIKYQTTGRCKASCSRAHMDPRKIPRDARASTDEGIKKLYEGL